MGGAENQVLPDGAPVRQLAATQLLECFQPLLLIRPPKRRQAARSKVVAPEVTYLPHKKLCGNPVRLQRGFRLAQCQKFVLVGIIVFISPDSI